MAPPTQTQTQQPRPWGSVNNVLRVVLLLSAIILIRLSAKVATPGLLDELSPNNGDPSFDVPTATIATPKQPTLPTESAVETKGEQHQTAPGMQLEQQASNNNTNARHVQVVAPDAANRTTLLQPQANGTLRHNWRHHPPLSDFAKLIDGHQSNCSLGTAAYHIDNNFGLGSHIALWSQGVCNAMQDGRRLRTHNPTWLWLDQTLCDPTQALQSPWLCYFPRAECLCAKEEHVTIYNVSDPRDKKRNQCNLLKRGNGTLLHSYRAASTEFLFQQVSELVIAEAERQVGLLFGGGSTPDDLITVHIRWGDKFWEMDLASIAEYTRAISDILYQQGKADNSTANIYLATEDPKAVKEFQQAIPPGWKVYYDRTVEELSDFRPAKGNRASHTSKNTKGRAGLVGMGSLLVAMEARWFVLTTASNWSRIMDHLRTQIINPRCNDCTTMVDLRPGIW